MKDYSQNGESKIIGMLLTMIGIHNPKVLDIGANDGYWYSNTRYFKDNGCHVDMYDGAPDRTSEGGRCGSDVTQMFVTVENIHETLKENYNVLSLDIDGNDFWVLDKLLSLQRPDVICFEVNSQLDLDQCKTIKYNPEFIHDGSIYFGMSYLAGCKLLRKYGYTIFTVVNHSNIIAFRNDHSVTPELYSFGKTHPFPFKEGEWVNV